MIHLAALPNGVTRLGSRSTSLPMQADALVLAGDVAARLEQYGVVACGRKQDGVTRVDFWSHGGKGYQCRVTGAEDVETLVAACLQIAGIEAPPQKPAPSSWS